MLLTHIKCPENYYTQNASQYKYICVKSYPTEKSGQSLTGVIVVSRMRLGNIL